MDIEKREVKRPKRQVKRRKPVLADLIPPPHVVREKLARNYREANLLRRLMKLSLSADGPSLAEQLRSSSAHHERAD